MADAPAQADRATRDLAIRCAWLYHVEGLTQDAVARSLHLSRAKVLRLLVTARDEGLVRIGVHAPAATRAALEARLVERYGLRAAVVVESGRDRADVARRVGEAAGQVVAGHLSDGVALAVGWGATLSAAAAALGAPAHRRLSVISLLGGMTRSGAVNPAAVARRIADTVFADCYQLKPPLMVANAATRAALWTEEGLRDLLARARRADLALVSCGDVTEAATLHREGLVSRAELASLRRAGAVADVLCQFVDSQGRPVDHPLNRRTVAVPLGDVRGIGTLVLASGGADKARALAAALAAVPVHVLVTDEAAAEALAGPPRAFGPGGPEGVA